MPWRRLIALLLLAAWHAAMPAQAAPGEGDITLQGRYAIDDTATRTVQDLDGGAVPLHALDRHRAFATGDGALWMRFELPPAHAPGRRFLMLSGAAFINRASLFTPAPEGGWTEQRAGDHLPVSQWPHPNHTPLFDVPAAGGTAWLRLENHPAPTSPYVQLLDEDTVQADRRWTFLLVGGYLGFGVLVFLMGLMHGRLYGDRSFHAYCAYVAFMLLFQLAFTGLGGLFFWPDSPGLNDAAPGLFMLLMTATGIWFTRDATALARHGRRFDFGALGFSAFGVALAAVYTLAGAPTWAFALLNAYGLSAVLLSIAMCLWTWRHGERHSLWLFFGFLPVHLAYPFPALRSAGLLPDSWATQYAVLIGSAIEIPALLWILHTRAKDFSENSARLRALDSTDPLTGLPIVPVFRLRLRDALRRAQRMWQGCAVLMVELSNHAEIVERAGREAGERALVIAAARLSSVVRDMDTVCRVADTRFAILIEGQQPEDARRRTAQHAVARGLEPLSQLPADLALHFRVVTAAAPEGTDLTPDGTMDDQRLLDRLHRSMDRLLGHPRRVIHHLDAPGGDASLPEPTAR